MNEDADDEVVSSVDSDLCIIDIPSEVTSQDVSSLITEEVFTKLLCYELNNYVRKDVFITNVISGCQY